MRFIMSIFFFNDLVNVQHNGELLTFESPSAFSIFFKRLVNPSRKADDGWKTVRFQGKFLDHYKMEYARRRFGAPVWLHP